MRLYFKLVLLASIAYGGQALLASGAARETYFAMRCFVAYHSGDQSLERNLICECERQLVSERVQATAIALATYDDAAWR